DACAAFRIATLSGLNPFDDLAEIIIESSNQPPFVAVAVEQALRNPEDLDKWATLFAEAGLTSEAAATTLSRRADRPWQENAMAVEPCKSWSRSSTVSRSFYGDCLTLSYVTERNIASTTLVKLFKKIPGPGSQPIVEHLTKHVEVYTLPAILIGFVAGIFF